MPPHFKTSKFVKVFICITDHGLSSITGKNILHLILHVLLPDMVGRACISSTLGTCVTPTRFYIHRAQVGSVEVRPGVRACCLLFSFCYAHAFPVLYPNSFCYAHIA